MAGATVSNTLTVVVQVALLLYSSVTVSVTVVLPISSQSKLVLSIAKVKALAAVQLSEEPSFISSAVMVATPLASN